MKLETENELVSFQMKEMKKIRKEEEKGLKALQVRHANELQRLASSEQKELDQLSKAQEQELGALGKRHQSEKEDFERSEGSELKKFKRQLKDLYTTEFNAFKEAQKKSKKAAKEEFKAASSNLSSSEYKAQKKERKDQEAAESTRAEKQWTDHKAVQDSSSHLGFNLSRLPFRHDLERKQLEEVCFLQQVLVSCLPVVIGGWGPEEPWPSKPRLCEAENGQAVDDVGDATSRA